MPRGVYKRTKRHIEIIRKYAALRRTPLSEKFWSRVHTGKSDDCWEWTGLTKNNGYGQLSFRQPDGRLTCHLAHRLAFAIAGTPIPAGTYVDHKCRNRLCVNIKHLRFVTPRISVLENCTSPSALNAKKTHCKRGHPFTGRNLRIKIRDGKESRSCRACNRLIASHARERSRS